MQPRSDKDLGIFRLPLTPFARREEVLYAGLPALVSAGLVVGWAVGGPLALGVVGIVGFVLAGGAASFFRDPRRVPPGGDETVVSPADGTVIRVEETDGDDFVAERAIEIDIFLSILNAHVNRAPISGTVESIEHEEGRYLSALRAEAGSENERNTVKIRGESVRVTVRQIAGAIARRIVCVVRVGDRVERGATFGMIKFGSRTQIVLPASVFEPSVKPGDKVKAGISVIGKLKPADEPVVASAGASAGAGASTGEGESS